MSEKQRFMAAEFSPDEPKKVLSCYGFDTHRDALVWVWNGPNRKSLNDQEFEQAVRDGVKWVIFRRSERTHKADRFSLRVESV